MPPVPRTRRYEHRAFVLVEPPIVLLRGHRYRDAPREGRLAVQRQGRRDVERRRFGPCEVEQASRQRDRRCGDVEAEAVVSVRRAQARADSVRRVESMGRKGVVGWLTYRDWEVEVAVRDEERWIPDWKDDEWSDEFHELTAGFGALLRKRG
jgi:hypothetical protein